MDICVELVVKGVSWTWRAHWHALGKQQQQQTFEMMAGATVPF